MVEGEREIEEGWEGGVGGERREGVRWRREGVRWRSDRREGGRRVRRMNKEISKEEDEEISKEEEEEGYLLKRRGSVDDGG